MKKLIVSTVLLFLVTVFTHADEVEDTAVEWEGLSGRYALNCSAEKSHNLSYVISDTQITRLVAAKKKTAPITSVLSETRTDQAEYSYNITAKYAGFTVHFYQKNQQNFALVKNTSIANFYGPKTNAMLQQCPMVKS